MKTVISLLIFIIPINVFGQTFTIKGCRTFVPKNQKVCLLENGQTSKLILFRSNLQVNTDGIPISYHPYDLRGDSIALNTILNGVAIYRKSDNVRISNPKEPNKFTDREKLEMRKKAYQVFEQWRDSGFDIVQPVGYKIIWANVLIPRDGKPCIMTSGNYTGYFASATALKNGLTTDMGECECKNQVDPFVIPALVLAGKHPKYGNSPVTVYGAKVGDLLVAYNPKNKKLVYAIVGDTGPEKNLGEGSVILNMKLTEKTKYPKTKKETYDLATGEGIIICIIPQSNSYSRVTPYTQENIQERIIKWFSEQHINGEQEIISLIEGSKSQL
ncbi:MAG TPA: hypothetical protein VM802_30645 [Chitinophaga sp.]|uniref:hypothetical protein n=1 Tax=Chitinophaga sp. TaxID=1869181 RepID=UPI002C33E258|nr:hypothetical protein [Chitinophaga sp.]HVI49264.1 hypothetical protein [Chitinophaga sp.]